MVILLIGGTGKTSIRLAPLLQQSPISFLLTSCRVPTAAPSGIQAAKFDWLDPSTFPAPFAILLGKISAIYLISPKTPDPITPMNAFIDYAIKEHDVKRFLLLGRSTLEKGKVWRRG